MTETTEAVIAHADLAQFADDRVNLKREDVKEKREQVERLRGQIETYIAEHPSYSLEKILQAGSLRKGTALKTLNDIDLALYVWADSVPKNEADLLNWLTDRIREANPKMAPDQIKPSEHCVNVDYKGTGLTVQVAPVHYDGDKDDRGYLVNRDTGKRVLTSIPLHLAFMRKRKDSQPGHFAQVVRFIKWWAALQKSRDAQFRMRSFMVELIAAHLADTGLDMSDYPRALEKVFAYIVRSQLRQRISFTDNYPASQIEATPACPIQIYDPVNPANNVCADYTDAERRLIVSAAQDAQDAIAEARYSTTKDRAVQRWQVVLGPSFRG